MATGNVSAQNNVVTAAEYQAAADEITAIIDARRADRAPVERELDVLRNRAERQVQRRDEAYNQLLAAEAGGNADEIEAANTVYRRAQNDVVVTSQAQQQVRSVLRQEQLTDAQLQDQRNNLEVNAEFASKAPPNQNSITPPATATPDQSATFVPPPAQPISPTVTPATQPAAQPAAAPSLAAQNNVTTAAEYQAAADEITAIIEAKRIERAPLERELDVLRNRAERQQQRQTDAYNQLLAAEAGGNADEIEAANTVYRRAQNDVVVTNQAQQQVRSVLRQEQLEGALLQDQRNNLEVNAEFAGRSPPNQNSLTPPATVIPDQSATYVPPPPPPVLVETSPKLLTDAEIEAIYPATDPQEVGALRGTTVISDEARRIMSDPAVIAQQQSINARAVSPVPPTVEARELSEEETGRLLDAAENPPAENNVSVADQWGTAELEIASAARGIRAENVEIAANLTELQRQGAAAARFDRALENQIIDARLAGASDLEISQLEAQQIEAVARTDEFTRQIRRQESVLAQNQETLDQLQQQRFIAEQAQTAAGSGPPGLNSTPGPATDQPDLDPAAYDLPPQTYADNFQANNFAADGDEAISAYEQAQLAQQEGQAFAQIPDVAASGDEALQAYDEAVFAQTEGRAFAQIPDVAASGDEALQAYDEALFAQTEGQAFATQPQALNDPLYGLTPEQIQALGGADPTDPYIRARLGIPQLPGSELQATPGFGTIKTGVPIIDNALSFLGGLFGRSTTPPAPAAAPVSTLDDPEARAIQDAIDADLAAQEGAAFADPVTLDDPEARAIQDAIDADLAAQEGTAFAEPVTLDDPEARAIQDAIDADLAAQEGVAFAEPVSTLDDPEARAIQDAVDADLAAQEGTAFAEPVTLDDPEARAIQDAIDADLAEQEGRAFPPVEAPAPVDPNDAVTAFQDVEAAELAALEGSAFVVDEPLPVDVGSDEELRAIEDAQAADLAAQEGTAFAEPVTLDDPEARAIQDALDADLAAQEGSAFAEPVTLDDPEARAIQDALDADLAAQESSAFVTEPAPVDGDPAYGGATDEEAAAINDAFTQDALESEAAAIQTAKEQQLREQFTIQQRYNTSTQGDWRVRIRLAPGANYLYKAPAGQRGILEPLVASDGVIFPYTPTITTSYQAKYDSYNLTHSNYRGYFYQNSSVGDISINGMFTAQDTTEAQYVLAVIHFFRSVTKMFYGKDQFRGAPPPLVELSGFGQYQFNNHPCLVASFNYSLPKDVDYIQIAPNNQGLNLGNRPPKVSSSPSSTLESVSRRLSTAGLPKGGQTSPADLGVVAGTVNGTVQTTYVPTKIEIAITLHPLQTRQQVSQAFSLENFANGNLLKGGFW